MPPPPFYRPIPKYPNSYAPDAQTTSICHASPQLPHSVHPEDCTNPHCVSYSSATPRTSISPSSVSSSPDFADLLSSSPRFQSVDAMDRLQTVLDDLHRWMQSNQLKLNPDKTQFIWLGNRYQLQKIDHQLLSARFPGVVFQDSVIDLGVTLDGELTMSLHVGNTCRSGFYHLRQLRLIRRHLTDETAATLVDAFVLTRIDYCNAVLVGTTKQQLNRLQMVLNTAARLLLRIPKFGHISSAIINTLHWLPVPDRITFKICCLIWNSVVGAGPSYLRELCTWSSVGSGWVLRSSTSSFLKVPFCRSATTQRRAFAVTGPASWNSIPLQLRLLSNDRGHALTFKKQLKSFLFPRISSAQTGYLSWTVLKCVAEIT